MTQPGSNDDVIKVVYQALADYSQLLRETRRAREETRALKADINGIAGTVTAKVKVTADTAQARTELAAVLRDVVVKVKVTVDALTAQTELARILKNAVVKIKVTVDAAAAQAELGRLLRDTTLQVRVVADTARLRQQIAAAVEGATAKVSVQLQRTDAIAKMRALITYLQALGPVKLDVKIDDGGQLAALEARLARLRRAGGGLGGGGGGGDPGRGGGGGGNGGGGGGGTPGPAAPKPSSDGGGGVDISSIKDGALASVSTATGLLSKFALIGAAVVPIAGAATAAIGTIGATLLSAGAAAGIFAVAAVGQISKVTEASKAAAETGAPLAGEVGKVVAAVREVKERYNELLDATEKPVFAVFIRGLDIALSLLDKVQPLISGVAGAIDDALKGVQDSVNGAGFDQFLGFVDRTGPAAVKGLITTIVDLTAGLGSLLQQFEPFVPVFVDGFAKAGAAFRDWAASLDTNTAFQSFLDYAIQSVPLVINLLLNLLDAAINIGTALAPLGNLLLIIANGIAVFVGALNPAAILVTVGALLGFNTALKLLRAAFAVTELTKGFTEALPGLAARLGVTATAAGAARLALIGLGAALGIGVLIAGIAFAVSKLGEANADAAKKTQEHVQAVTTLAKALRENKGVVDSGIRETAYSTLAGLGAGGSNGGPGFSADILDASDAGVIVGTGNKTIRATRTLPQAAQDVGADLKDLVSGSLGDDKARERVLGAFDKFIAERNARIQELLKNPTKNRQEISQLSGEVEINKQARKAYADSAVSSSELTAEIQRQNLAVGDNTDATAKAALEQIKAAKTYATSAEAAKALREDLKAAAQATEEQSAATAAFSASDAYDKAVEAYSDHLKGVSAASKEVKAATEGLTDANNRAADAQDNLNRAREDAKQRLIDLQRQLRDLPLDEEQAKISAQRSAEALQKAYNTGGVSELDLRQLKIDATRGANALADFQQDKPGKKKRAEDELALGITGNKNLRDALIDNSRAQEGVKTAQDRTRRATKALRDEGVKLKQNVDDTKTAFEQAAGAIGLTATAVGDLKTKLDKLKSKGLKVTVDTKDAEAKLRNVLLYEVAAKLIAADPSLTIKQALDQAAAQIPTVAKDDPGQNIPKAALIRKGMADGGAATAGPVYGPGTATSDQVRTTLPVGGPVALSPGEHIVTDAEVKNAPGGHGYLELFRQALRAGTPWQPPAYAAGGATGLAALLPSFAAARPLPRVPGYAAGGAVSAAARTDGGPAVRQVNLYGGIHVSNPRPETASDSLYKTVRRLGDPDAD